VSRARIPGRGPLDRQRRWLGRHRRVLAAGLAAAAVLSATAAVSQESATAPTLVAARELSGGAPLAPADLRVALVDPAVVPAGALRSVDEAVGRVLAVPVRDGEVLTDVRLLGSGLLDGYGAQGLVGAPVRIADVGAARLLRVGDLIDVLAAQPQRDGAVAARPARVVAAAVRVVAIPAADPDERSGLGAGALVVLAASARTAAALASAGASAPLSVTLLPR